MRALHILTAPSRPFTMPPASASACVCVRVRACVCVFCACVCAHCPLSPLHDTFCQRLCVCVHACVCKCACACVCVCVLYALVCHIFTAPSRLFTTPPASALHIYTHIYIRTYVCVYTDIYLYTCRCILQMHTCIRS